MLPQPFCHSKQKPYAAGGNTAKNLTSRAPWGGVEGKPICLWGRYIKASFLPPRNQAEIHCF